MLELNKISAYPSFSIKGNLRATIFVKKDDIYSFKKYDDLICDKECYNNKYKNFRQQILSLKNNSLGKLDEIENPEKKHHKSKSVAYAAINYDDNEIKEKKKPKNNIEAYNSNNSKKINYYKNSAFKNEFEIGSHKIKESKEILENDVNKDDVYFSGKKIINLMNLNSNSANKNFNNNSNEKNLIGSFNLASSLKNKINLNKIEKPQANEADLDELSQYFYNDSCLNKLENMMLLKTLEDCEIVNEIDENKNDNNFINKKTDRNLFKSASGKKHFTAKKPNEFLTSEEKNLLKSSVPSKENCISNNEYNYNINSYNYNKAECFKTKDKKDYLTKNYNYNNKKSHIESTDAPDKSFISNRKLNLEQDSNFMLNTNENLEQIDFNFYKNNNEINYEENSELNSENLTVTDDSNIEASNYLSSVSHTVNAEFKKAFHEVKNIKKNLFLTEEEFRKSEIKLETIEKDFVDFLNEKESNDILKKSNCIQDAIGNVDLFYNNNTNIVKDKKIIKEDVSNKINIKNFKNNDVNNYFDCLRNFKIEASSYKNNKIDNEELKSLKNSATKAVATEFDSAVKNDNFIRGRSFLIENDKKPLIIINCSTADNLKKNFNEINLSKYKIFKQNCQEKYEITPKATEKKENLFSFAKKTNSNENFKAYKSSNNNICPINIQNFTINNPNDPKTKNQIYKTNYFLNSLKKQKPKADNFVISNFINAIDLKISLSPQSRINSVSTLTQNNSNLNNLLESQFNNKSNIRNRIEHKTGSDSDKTIMNDIYEDTSSKSHIGIKTNSNEKIEKNKNEKKENLAKILKGFKRKASYSDTNIIKVNKEFSQFRENLLEKNIISSQVFPMSKQPDKPKNISLLIDINVIQDENESENSYFEVYSDEEIDTNVNKINKRIYANNDFKKENNFASNKTNNEESLKKSCFNDYFNDKNQKQIRMIDYKDLKLINEFDNKSNNKKETSEAEKDLSNKKTLNYINNYNKKKAISDFNNSKNKVLYNPTNKNVNKKINPFDAIIESTNREAIKQIKKNSFINKSKNKKNTYDSICDKTLKLSPFVNKKLFSDLKNLEARNNFNYNTTNNPFKKSHLSTNKKEPGLSKNKNYSNKIIMKNIRTTNFNLKDIEKENSDKENAKENNKKLILKKTTDSTPENTKNKLLKLISKENISIKIINVESINFELNMYKLKEFKDLFYLELFYTKPAKEFVFSESKSNLQKNTIKKIEKILY